MNNLQLKTVCPIPLKKMKSCTSGFYCGSCSKTVIDVRNKPVDEILKLKGSGSCLLFNRSQLAQPRFSLYKKVVFRVLTIVALLGFNVKPMDAQSTKKSCSSNVHKTQQQYMPYQSRARHRHKYTKGIVMWRKRSRRKYDRLMGFF